MPRPDHIDELAPNTYKVPLRLRHQAARKEVYSGLVAFAFSIVGTVFLQTDRILHAEGSYWIRNAGDPWLLAAMYGLVAVTLAVLGWAYFFKYKRGSVWYDVGKVTLVFTDHQYFVPKNVMRDWIREHVYDKFRPFLARAPEEVMPDCAVILEGFDMKIGDYDIYGKTYPARDVSHVEAWYVMSEGVMDWELKLQLMDVLFPFQSEGDDIEWLKQRGI